MKTLILFLSLFLVSCSCLIGQIPPQYLSPGVNCTVAIPDYRPFFTIVAGCTGYNMTQTPLPGTIMTTANSPMNVIVKTTSKTNSKFTQRTIVVNFADTITPQMTPIGILAEVTMKKINDLYGAGDKLFGFLDENMATQYNNSTVLDTIPGFRDHLLSGDYHTKALVSISYDKPDGTRAHDFNFADSVKIINKFK